MNNDNQINKDMQQPIDSNLKEMCCVVEKEMCHIDYDSPAYLAEQEALRKKEDQSTTDLGENNANSVSNNETDARFKSAISNNVRSIKAVPRGITPFGRLPMHNNFAPKHNGIVNLPADILQPEKGLLDSDVTVLENTKPSNPSPHSIMRKFIEKVNVVTYNSEIYIYNGRYYMYHSIDDVKSLILDMFRDEIEDNSPSYVSNIVDFLKMEPEIKITDAHIRTDLVSFNNGVLNITDGTFHPHHPSYITTYSIQANYKPNEVCNTPYFDDYLFKLSGDDMVLIERIYQLIGYSLTQDTRAKILILLQGIHSSGKSVLIRFLERLLSPGSFYPVQADKLKSQFALSELFGRILCVCQDMPNEPLDMKAVSVLKCISGNDTISSDVKFKRAISFQCRAKVIMATNFAVITKSHDEAFTSRLLTIPCRHSVPKHEQNPNLINFIINESDGIVTKAIAAYFRLVQNGYVFAGDYQPNSAVNFNKNVSEDIEMNVFNFTMSNFEIDPNSHVFTEDAHKLYLSQNFNIARNDFSKIFKRICLENFGATDGRRYKEFVDENGELKKSPNALRCVIGIRFKDNG